MHISSKKKELERGMQLSQFCFETMVIWKKLEKDISLCILKWPLSLSPNTSQRYSSHENLRTSYARLKRLLFGFIVLLTQHTVQFKKRKPNPTESGWNRAWDQQKMERREKRGGKWEESKSKALSCCQPWYQRHKQMNVWRVRHLLCC